MRPTDILYPLQGDPGTPAFPEPLETTRPRESQDPDTARSCTPAGPRAAQTTGLQKASWAFSEPRGIVLGISPTAAAVQEVHTVWASDQNLGVTLPGLLRGGGWALHTGAALQKLLEHGARHGQPRKSAEKQAQAGYRGVSGG